MALRPGENPDCVGWGNRNGKVARRDRHRVKMHSRRVQPVHQDSQPTGPLGHPDEKAESPQEIEIFLAPVGDRLVVVAVGDGAHRKETALWPVDKPPDATMRLPRILNVREMIHNPPKLRRLLKPTQRQGHAAALRISRPSESPVPSIVNRHQPDSNALGESVARLPRRGF